MTSEERFLSHVNKTSNCWLWTAHKHYKGYGILNRKGKVLKAHRFSYELYKGKIPAGLQVDHLCRIRNCVNPEHLELVDNRENVIRGATVLNKKAPYPAGVNKVGNKFRAQKKVKGLKSHIGYFDTPELAHEAYLVYGGI
jgi:hypothetical protein